MKLERKLSMLEAVIKSCFLTLCGLIPYFYINYETIQSYEDWRKDLIIPIIWIDVIVFIVMCITYVFVARRDK